MFLDGRPGTTRYISQMSFGNTCQNALLIRLFGAILISLQIQNGCLIASPIWHDWIAWPQKCTFCIFIWVSLLIINRNRYSTCFTAIWWPSWIFTTTWIILPTPYRWIVIGDEESSAIKVDVLHPGFQAESVFHKIR